MSFVAARIITDRGRNSTKSGYYSLSVDENPLLSSFINQHSVLSD